MDDGYEDVGRFDYHPNAPLRGTKGTLFEGGHRVPFLARWPGQIAAGTTSNALIAHLDLAATFAALTGARIPAGQCLDSVNVLPALLGKSAVGRNDFVAHIGGTQGPFAMRSGDWKYIAPRDESGKGATSSAKKNAASEPQLYNLKTDPAEERNLADSQTGKRDELRALLAKIRGMGN
jgi:arylsulfatase A-like enzyme